MARDRKTAALNDAARASDDDFRNALNRLLGRDKATADFASFATGPIGQTVIAAAAGRALRSYPLATVLVGAGLAWLTFGKGSDGRLSDKIGDQIDDWRAQADAAREAAQDRLAKLYDSMSARASNRGASAAAFAQQRAGVTADLARDLTKAFGHGLSGLSADAAERIIEAREQAYAAFANAQDHLKEHTIGTDTRGFVRRHPVATTAVALAIAAALTSAVQANRRDGGSLTESAEDLLKRARDTVDAESRNLGQAAQSLRDRGTEAALSLTAELAAMLERLRGHQPQADMDEPSAKPAPASKTAAKAPARAKRPAAKPRTRKADTKEAAVATDRVRPN